VNEKIFRSSFLTSLLVLFVSFVLIFGILFEYFEQQIMSELKNEVNYISYAIESEGIGFIDNFKGSDKRITLVSSDGKVLADTSANSAELDNHAKREEITEADKNGWGSSSRYSDTLMQKISYYAVRLENGDILRVSTTQNSVWVLLLSLMQPLIVIVVIVMLISLYLSHRLSKAIVKPINDLDLENPTSGETYEELTPLLKKISIQKRTIERQIKEARQKQEEFRLISENMSEGLIVTDIHSNILSCNHSALRLLEAEGAKMENVLMLSRTKNFRSTVEKALSGKRAECDLDINEQKYRLIANPAFEGSNVIGTVIMIIDITESANREQLRREFTSNVSHELKTPLTSISGFAEMMKAGGTDDSTVVDFSTSIYDEAQRLITLVTDIIKLSELDEKPVQPIMEKVDLYELAQEIIDRLKPVADRSMVELRLFGEHTVISGTRKILSEMVYNLCDNAIKYNKKNGTVDIVVSGCDEGKVYLTVRDTGIGIPYADQSRVFERFYRVDKSHSKQVGGTGLGLSIVKHGAAYHNAEIILESALDKGTRITVEFNV